MANGVVTPAIPTANDVFLGEGAVYRNYGEVTQALIGATSGGSKLTISKPLHSVAIDGTYGKVKNMERTDRFEVGLTVNLLKINYTNLAYGNPITISDGADKDGTYKEITFDLDINASDVLTNVTFVGQKFDGDAVLIKVLNALCTNNLKFDFKPKSEISLEMTYNGYYTSANPTTPPLEIWDYSV
jgi:hypothetical protein